MWYKSATPRENNFQLVMFTIHAYIFVLISILPIDTSWARLHCILVHNILISKQIN